MRRHHNPRYAPESLERKLNPSGIVGIPVTAEIYVPNTQFDDVASPDSTAPIASDISDPVPSTDPTLCTDPGDPPIDEPTSPVGPDMPA